MPDIEKLALLARIKLTSTEKEKLQKEFGDILEYVSQLKQVDVRSAKEERATVLDLRDVMRDDNKANEPGRFSEVLLKEAPMVERGYVKVKHIFE